ncbi:MAG: GDSL-type esterase/lipase family protein [Negativicutes bacterium]
MKRRFSKSTFFSVFIVSLAAFIWAGPFIFNASSLLTAWAACKTQSQTNKPVSTVYFSEQNPASVMPVLTWTKIDGAVAYEIELLTKPPGNSNKPVSDATCFFSTKKVYVNGFNADVSANFTGEIFYWRVRGLDFDGNPISRFSDAEKVYVNQQKNAIQKPVPLSIFNQSAGATLLYPVYAWIPVSGADKYEVEILDALPENPNGTAPSIHRIDSAIAVGFDYYDKNPRFSNQPFYWRVRGLAQDGSPVGVYSDAEKFSVNPNKHVAAATYGDSITHGGGGISHPPSDWEYSYQHYLDFPTVNLGKSGDTSQTMVERFEEDVLPFHPQYLIILAGTNSLRGGVTAEDVIADLRELKEKCVANNIRPVFLTLPPINPNNIKKAFDEPTAPDWQKQMRLVNNFIRTQVHIDVAREMEYKNGILPTKLAVDGLHLDIEGKKKIAAVVNANWNYITLSTSSLDFKVK